MTNQRRREEDRDEQVGPPNNVDRRSDEYAGDPHCLAANLWTVVVTQTGHRAGWSDFGDDLYHRIGKVRKAMTRPRGSAKPTITRMNRAPCQCRWMWRLRLTSTHPTWTMKHIAHGSSDFSGLCRLMAPSADIPQRLRADNRVDLLEPHQARWRRAGLALMSSGIWTVPGKALLGTWPVSCRWQARRRVSCGRSRACRRSSWSRRVPRRGRPPRPLVVGQTQLHAAEHHGVAGARVGAQDLLDLHSARILIGHRLPFSGEHLSRAQSDHRRSRATEQR